MTIFPREIKTFSKNQNLKKFPEKNWNPISVFIKIYKFILFNSTSIVFSIVSFSSSQYGILNKFILFSLQ